MTDTEMVLAGIEERDLDRSRLTGDRWGRSPEGFTTELADQRARRKARIEAMERTSWVPGRGFV